jgi:DNA-binding NarL/FixJ family response regulator
MNHFFVTNNGELQSRWLEAFPDAQNLADVNQLRKTSKPFVVWFNRASVAEGELAKAIATITGLNGRVVVMSGVLSDEQGLEAVTSGAVGYVHFLAKPSQLQEVAVVVEKGGLWLGESLLQKFMAASRLIQANSSALQSSFVVDLSALTEKEQQVAQQVGKGATNKEIAEALSMSERTVKAHLTSTFDKLNVRDRVQLALLVNGVG